jgi:hypothetical protein
MEHSAEPCLCAAISAIRGRIREGVQPDGSAMISSRRFEVAGGCGNG